MKYYLFAALFCSSFFISSCDDAPAVTVCVYSADRCEFDCTDASKNQFVLDCKDPRTNKFEAMPSTDFHQLVLWIKDHR